MKLGSGCCRKTLKGHISKVETRHAAAIGAFLVRANLSRANLTDAILPHADLRNANLSFARNLTQERLRCACGDDKTPLPEDLTIKRCPVAAPPASPSPPTAPP